MDPKVIEMNNLRVLNDYLNQTLDVLVRGQRLAGGPAGGLGYSTFGGTIPGAPGGLGTDVVYGASPFGFAGLPLFGAHALSPYAAVNPFNGALVARRGLRAAVRRVAAEPVDLWPDRVGWPGAVGRGSGVVDADRRGGAPGAVYADARSEAVGARGDVPRGRDPGLSGA